MVKTLDNETLDGPQQIVFLAYHKSKLSKELSPLSNQGYPVSSSVEIITKFGVPVKLQMKRETKYIETKQNEMYTKTGRDCNLAKRNIPKRIVVHRPLETSTNQSDVIKRSDNQFLYLVVDSDS